MRRTAMFLALAGVVALVWYFAPGQGAGARSERAGACGSGGACAPAEGAPDEGASTDGYGVADGRLVVLVVDEEGDPVVGAAVDVWDDPAADGGSLRLRPPASDRRLVSDGDGRFAFACGGDVRLRVGAVGFAAACEVLGPGEHEIQLDASESCTLFAVDDAGKPVPSVAALVYSEPHDGWPSAVAGGDSHGRVRFWPGPFDRVLLRAPGFRTTVVIDFENGQRVVLEPGLSLRGTIVDETDRPVGGAAVVRSGGRVPSERVFTAADGAFAFDGLGDRSVALHVKHADFLRQQLAVRPGDDEVRIRLRRAVSQAGTVVLPDGAPASGASVRIGRNGPAFTDAQGRFRMAELPPGPAKVEVSYGRMEALPGETAPPPAYRATLDLTIPTDALRIRLEGRPRSFVPWLFVDEAGTPLAGVKVSGARKQSDEAGRALSAFPVAAGTEVQVSVTRGGWFKRWVVPTGAVADEPRRVTVRKLREITVVVRLPGGRPLPAGTNATIAAGATRSRRTGPDRQIVAVDPDATRVHVEASAPGYAPRKGPFEIPADGVVEIELFTGATVRGVAVDGAGNPVRLAVVLLPDIRTRIATGNDGSFAVSGVPPGATTLRIWNRATDSGAYRKLEVQDGDVLELGRIRLAPPRIMRCSVTDDRGRPLQGAFVLAGRNVANTGADGRFTLRVAAAFSDDPVLFHKAGFATVRLPQDAVPEQVRMQRAGRIRLRVERAHGQRRFLARMPGEEETFAPRTLGQRFAPSVVLYDLPPGDLEIGVRAANGEAWTTVRVVAGATVEATLRLP